MASPLGNQGTSPIVERLERLVYIHLLIVIAGVLSKSSLVLFDGFDILLWSSFLVSTWVIYMGPQFSENFLILSVNRCFHVIAQKLFAWMRRYRVSLHHQFRPLPLRWSSLGQSISALKSIMGRLSQRIIQYCLIEKSDFVSDESSSTEAVSTLLIAPPKQITLDRGLANHPSFHEKDT